MRYISGMAYSIVYYSPGVQAEIESWPPGVHASFVRIAEQMEETGPNLGLPYTRPFGDGLFEIRARGKEGIGRAFFCALTGKRIVILHGIIKKTQQTPPNELKRARKRMKEFQHG